MNRAKPLTRSPLLPGSSTLTRTSWITRSQGIRAGTASTSGQRLIAVSFSPVVAGQLDARDPWCVYCGSPRNLQRHHRRIRGMGSDGRDHTHCACNGVRLCLEHHAWAHSGKGRRVAEAEGLIIPRATVEPWTVSVLVRTDEDGGGMQKWPWCDGRYRDYPQPDEAAA